MLYFRIRLTTQSVVVISQYSSFSKNIDVCRFNNPDYAKTNNHHHGRESVRQHVELTWGFFNHR